MDISKLDKNFASIKINEPDLIWIDARDKRFSLHGGFYDDIDRTYRRIPKDVATSISENVEYFAKSTAGLRLRFSTNSPYIAIKAYLNSPWMASHLSITGHSCFGLSVNGIVKKPFVTDYDEIINCIDNVYKTEKIIYLQNDGQNDIEIQFPLYNSVVRLEIGLKNGSLIGDYSKNYSYTKPVLFYGSSITQGACACKPNTPYFAILSDKLNFDYINLGLSGGAKGEDSIINYISSIDASVYVLDYDHNADSVEHLQATHLKMYQKIRKVRPLTPIIFISKPDIKNYDYNYNVLRRDVIIDTYKKAIDLGDKNVYFIDGETFFGDDWMYCTVDDVHPNDLGFYKMAEKIYPVLKTALDKNQ